MFISRKLSFTILLLAFTISATFAAVPKGDRPCNIAVKCSNKEEIVWATDGSDCIPWRNGCQLSNENCQRQNRYAEVLKVVTKDECQKLCKDFCTANYAPVCAVYNDVPRTFSNSCALGAHICRSGEIYDLRKIGECEPIAAV